MDWRRELDLDSRIGKCEAIGVQMKPAITFGENCRGDVGYSIFGGD